jgi:hypothetical protein
MGYKSKGRSGGEINVIEYSLLYPQYGNPLLCFRRLKLAVHCYQRSGNIFDGSGGNSVRPFGPFANKNELNAVMRRLCGI